MKYLSAIFALLAVSFMVADGWYGPVYTMSDWCECHRSRTWLEFDDSASLRGMQLFLRVEEPGDSQHKHQFCDPQWGGQYPVLFYIGVGFGLSSAAAWFYGRKREFQNFRYEHLA